VLESTCLDHLIVHYSSSQTKCNNIGASCKLIHEGKVSDLGFITLTKNHPDVLVDDGKLDDTNLVT